MSTRVSAGMVAMRLAAVGFGAWLVLRFALPFFLIHRESLVRAAMLVCAGAVVAIALVNLRPGRRLHPPVVRRVLLVELGLGVSCLAALFFVPSLIGALSSVMTSVLILGLSYALTREPLTRRS